MTKKDILTIKGCCWWFSDVWFCQSAIGIEWRRNLPINGVAFRIVIKGKTND